MPCDHEWVRRPEDGTFVLRFVCSSCGAWGRQVFPHVEAEPRAYSLRAVQARAATASVRWFEQRDQQRTERNAWRDQ